MHSASVHAIAAITCPQRVAFELLPIEDGTSRNAMKKFLIASHITLAGLVALGCAASANAAQVTNKDSKAVVVVVVDGGNRMEVAIDAGATEIICPSGCFMTAPNGDRVGLGGSEKVEIVGGAAIVQ